MNALCYLRLTNVKKIYEKCLKIVDVNSFLSENCLFCLKIVASTILSENCTFLSNNLLEKVLTIFSYKSICRKHF